MRAFFNSLEYLLAMQSNVAGRFDECVVTCIDEGVVACLDKNNKDDLEKIQIWTAATRDMISSQL